MALKIDLSKAFDSLELSFIYDTLKWFNFPDCIIKLIMSCITTTSISVLWKGQITESFCPTRGIKGDPLSPYIMPRKTLSFNRRNCQQKTVETSSSF